MSQSSFRRAINTNDLQRLSLIEVVASIVGVWPLIVSHLKEIGKKTDAVSLVE